MYKLRGFSVALIFATLISIPAKGQSQRQPSSDENSVYEAVLGLMDHFPIDDPHVAIFGVTLNSKCGEEANPLPLANGCSFLWIKPGTAKDVKKLLHEEWADFDNSTWDDFEAKNASSVRLQEPITTPWKHKLVFPEDGPSKDLNSPNLTIFLSRVGYNHKKTEAVVYVLIFSYMDQVDTAGDYFLFRIDKTGHWEPNGRVTYFSKGKDQSSN
ncbi:MAG: hypothetical protein ABSB60_06745 [Terracidiphilus sp.]|jgi:hypothetical protein